MPNPPNPGERELVDLLRARLNAAGGQFGSPFKSGRGAVSALKLGIGDDCAVLQPPSGHEILVTTDFSLETIHFRRDWQSPESIGHRCLARGLSDLAAMGARPLGAFLSLSLPLELVRSRKGQPSWRERFFSGFLALAQKHRVPLAGGDTAQSPRSPTGRGGHVTGNALTGWALADIVLVGSAPRGRALLRAGARAGDFIYVTGYLGGAAAELAQVAAAPKRFRDCTVMDTEKGGGISINPHPHLFPTPRVAVGAWLLKNNRATAAIDISDGLSTDLNHLCEESGLAATLEASLLPFHSLALKHSEPPSPSAWTLALDGGEDYELLFTAAPGMRVPRRIAGVPVTRVGRMRRFSARSPRMMLREENRERPLHPAGWEHFRR